MANQSIFDTTRRLTTHMPLRERAAWLFLSVLADVAYRSQQLVLVGRAASSAPRRRATIEARRSRALPIVRESAAHTI